MKELFENASPAAVELISRNMPAFVEHLQKITRKESDLQELNWKDHLMSFAWQLNQLPEMLEIIQAAKKLFESEKDFVALESYARLHSWKFDKMALQEYLEYVRSPLLHDD